MGYYPNHSSKNGYWEWDTIQIIALRTGIGMGHYLDHSTNNSLVLEWDTTKIIEVLEWDTTQIIEVLEWDTTQIIEVLEWDTTQIIEVLEWDTTQIIEVLECQIIVVLEWPDHRGIGMGWLM